MGINIRAKGQTGEREIADELNLIVYIVHKRLGLAQPEKDLIQRNQNQSAVGGSDLTGTFGLCIEIKRQEALSINTWWTQCTKAAQEFGGKPVLLFRQNKQKWRCILMAELFLPKTGESLHGCVNVRCEISYEDFQTYFDRIVERELRAKMPKPSVIAPIVTVGPEPQSLFN